MISKKTHRRLKQKRKAAAGNSERKLNAADQAIIAALRELQRPYQPRARIRLRAVMRQIGLDEWKIAWLLNFKVHYLARSRKSGDNKLLLDYLKEAARHLDTTSSRGATQETSAIEIVHEVPRPKRDEPDEQ